MGRIDILSNKSLHIFGGFTAGLYAATMFIAFLSAADLPTMAISTSTGECVHVLTPEKKEPCDFIKEGDRYQTMWVK